MIISGNYNISRISPIQERLVSEQEQQSRPDVEQKQVQPVQPEISRAPISNGLEASAGLNLEDGKAKIGTASKLEELDVAREMSVVQKDKALEQYQYFVNDKIAEDEDPFFRMIMKF